MIHFFFKIEVSENSDLFIGENKSDIAENNADEDTHDISRAFNRRFGMTEPEIQGKIVISFLVQLLGFNLRMPCEMKRTDEHACMHLNLYTVEYNILTG